MNVPWFEKDEVFVTAFEKCVALLTLNVVAFIFAVADVTVRFPEIVLGP